MALFRSFAVMKCEKISKVSELPDYLRNNLIIAHLCGFDITKALPSCRTFRRYIRNIDNNVLKPVMKGQVLELAGMKLTDGSFIGLDATPNAANTKLNNPKSFIPNKSDKNNPPKSDTECTPGVRTAPNQHNDKNYGFYRGYKNHILLDCITGLPISGMTTGAHTYDSTVALEILKDTHEFLYLDECCFIADAAYDVKEVCSTIREVCHGDACIPVNPRNTQNPELLPVGNPICEARLAMHKCGKSRDSNRTRQKFVCPLRQSESNICPCNHAKWNNGAKYRGCIKWITIPDDYRLSIGRTSKDFKSVYKLRTGCERYNSRFKATGQERLWVRNFLSAQNLNSFAHIAILAVAIASRKSDSHFSCRAISSIKRFA